MARKYFIETYGCQMNVHDSERMAGLLDQAGYEPTTDDRDADVVADQHLQRSRAGRGEAVHRLGEFHQRELETGERPIVAVAGCVAQQEGAQILKRSRAVDVIVGTQNLKRLPMLAAVARSTPTAAPGAARSISTRWGTSRFRSASRAASDPVKAYVTIIEGCNEFCAFCVVPYTRGHERMRPAGDILAEARQAVETGAREVQLLGQIVNHYQAPDDRLRLRGAAGTPDRDRRSRAHPLREPAPPPRHGPDDRRDAPAAEGLPASPPAGPVRLFPDPGGDAAAAHA